jgi:hypothetical protein
MCCPTLRRRLTYSEKALNSNLQFLTLSPEYFLPSEKSGDIGLTQDGVF